MRPESSPVRPYSSLQPRKRQKRRKQPSHQRVVKPKSRWLWVFGLLALWLVCTGAATFQPLSYRFDQFPQWQTKPPVEAAQGDLTYPDWFEGDWSVTTTLQELYAPLAPEVITPGFESNRDYLHQPVRFQARFQTQKPSAAPLPWLRLLLPDASFSSAERSVVADRALNGLNLARAYLNQADAGFGDRFVQKVIVDPQNPNRQVTRMQGDRQLISTIVGRLTEVPAAHRYLTTELSQQVFRGIPRPYINEVETTTDYRYQPRGSSTADTPTIVADQITAIYLSPQDPDYFKAGDRPVALYRYRLEFEPLS